MSKSKDEVIDGSESFESREYEPRAKDYQEALDQQCSIHPLYTHPSNVRRLSDDEINKVWVGQCGVTFDELPSLYDFANTIMDACNIPKEGE